MLEWSHSLIFFNFQFLSIEREDRKSLKKFKREMLERSHSGHQNCNLCVNGFTFLRENQWRWCLLITMLEK
jgi:spore germination protein YaaH